MFQAYLMGLVVANLACFHFLQVVSLAVNGSWRVGLTFACQPLYYIGCGDGAIRIRFVVSENLLVFWTIMESWSHSVSSNVRWKITGRDRTLVYQIAL